MELKEINEALNYYIRPQTFPLAVTMCKTEAEIPDKARRPRQALGFTVTVCQALAMARRYGWTTAIGKEDQSCPFGSLALGFVPAREGYLDGSFQESLGMATKEVAARTAQVLSRLEYGKYSHLLVAPLHTASFEPMLIVVYGNPAQVARLTQGAVRLMGGAITSSTVGGIACSSIIASPINNDECQFVVSGAGDRYFALTQDHEMVFALPMSKVETTIQGLEEGHRVSGHRYPTPSFLQFEVRLPGHFGKLMDLLEKGD